MAHYAIKEMFYTLQGEGAQAGRAAVFCRFAGCNLWTGREADRAKAICQFCDTDFVGVDGVGGGKFPDAAAVADAVAGCWPADAHPDAQDENNKDPGRSRIRPLVVCTGGEPLLQLDVALVDALHQRGFEIAIETNGTLAAPEGIDWICVSPKAGAPLVQQHGHELKLVYPQADAPPIAFEELAFDHFFLQPMDGAQQSTNTSDAVSYCMAHPQWRLSLQTHKFLGIP